MFSGDFKYPEIHCKHFFFGYPAGTPLTNDLIIRDDYALSSNDSTKFADWTAYRADTNKFVGSSKSRNWKSDPWLDPDETLETSDYKGAFDILNTDRGHQVPLASVKGSVNWYEVNYLSNITPQKSILNQGPWKILEELERKTAYHYNLIVYTGTLYNLPADPLPNADEKHKVPSGYWKILFVWEKNEKKFKYAAFIFNQDVKKDMSVWDGVVNIDEIELYSGLDFLHLLDKDSEDLIESSIDIEWLKLLSE